jgi:hypothetical protein
MSLRKLDAAKVFPDGEIARANRLYDNSQAQAKGRAYERYFGNCMEANGYHFDIRPDECSPTDDTLPGCYKPTALIDAALFDFKMVRQRWFPHCNPVWRSC